MIRWQASVPVLVAAVALLVANGITRASDFRTSDITGQGYGDVLPRLIGQDGRVRGRDDFKGRVTFIFFGFTHCPDLCPTTLLDLSTVIDRLGADRDRVQVALITVDPERDTPEVLRDYMSSFGPNFLGLTGAPDTIRDAARAFRVFFQKIRLPAGEYTMDHTAVVYMLDPQARVRLMFTGTRSVEDIVADTIRLLREKS
jgi:protein SCO1